MAIEIKVPQLGESLTEATVGRWLKREGDAVTEGETVVELETEKVNMEVPATAAGVLQSIVKHEGDAASVDDVLAIVAEGQPAEASLDTPAHDGKQRPQEASTVPAAGPFEARLVEQRQDVPRDNGDAPRATPLARRVAAEHNIDVSAVRGTGPSGRITRDDVTAHIENSRSADAPVGLQSATAPAIATGGSYPDGGAAMPAAATAESAHREERQRMSRRRLTIARRLVEAQQTAAMLTTFNEIDMSAIMEVRKRRRDSFKERHGVGLGFMSFFTKAVIGGLKEYPRLNAEIQGEEIILKRYYDIGVAVGTDEGLVVPVVREADRLSFAEIERQIGELAVKAHNKQLSLADLQGGTFTLTNGGIYGSLMSTPILNAPQVGILGMHKIQERPIAVAGDVVIKPMMYVALSYDHRIVDGSEAVRFLVLVKELLEDPESLLLEG
ncbi:MAG: 2-oxoglutarate dehydrogenase complex dihydrolipoyllysine-residue succinyltransferase [Chloroflexota bacterium]